MWNPSFMVITSLIALVVSEKSAVQPSRLDLICYKTVYNGPVLDATAQEACTLKNQKEGSPPDCRSCLTHVPSYEEKGFSINEPGELLKYPLAKMSISQKGDYHVIVLWHPKEDTCRAVGAIFRFNGFISQKCNKIKYLGWGETFVIDDYAVLDDQKLERLPSIAE